MPIRLRQLVPPLIASCFAAGVAPASLASAVDAQAPLTDIPFASVEQRAAAAREMPPELRDAVDAAQEEFDRGAFDRAAALVDKALRSTSALHFDALHLLARSCAAVGEHGRARVAAELAGLLQPGNPDVQFLLGRLALEQERSEDAIAHFHAAARAGESHPDSASALASWAALGDALLDAGRTRAAAQAFEGFNRALLVGPPSLRANDDVRAVLARHPDGLAHRALQLLTEIDRKADAVEMADRIVNAAPRSDTARRLYVDALLAADRGRDALDFASQVLLSSDPNAADHAALAPYAADAAIASGRLDHWARDAGARTLAPRHPAAARRVADRLLERGEFTAAACIFDALADNASDVDPALAWRQAAARIGRGDQAGGLKLLASLLSSDAALSTAATPDSLARWPIASVRRGDAAPPRAPDGEPLELALQALSAQAVGDDATLNALLAALPARVAGGSAARLLLAKLLIDRGAWADARTQASALIASDPNLAAAYWLHARAHDGLDEHAEAEDAYRSALRLDPDSVEIRLGLAGLKRRNGDLVAAQRYYQEAWEADPTRGDCLEALITAYLGGQKLELAHAAYDAATTYDLPEDALRRARTLLSFASLSAEEQRDELRRQHAAHPSDVRTTLLLAESLLVEAPDEALALLQDLPPRREDAERSAMLIARAHFNRCDAAAAVGVLSRLVERYPRRAAALEALASACLADFRVDEAMRLYDLLLDLPIEPEQRTTIRTQMLAALVEFRQDDEALARVDRWIAADPGDDALAGMKLRVLTLTEQSDAALAYARERLEAVDDEMGELLSRIRGAADRGGPRSLAPAQQASFERELREMGERLYSRREQFVETALETEQYAAAEKMLRMWSEDEPGQPRLEEWLIETLLAAEKGEDALAMLTRASPRSPVDAVQLVLWRGRALGLSGQSGQAAEALNTALSDAFVKANPAVRSQVRRTLVSVLVADGSFTDALRSIDEWLLEAGDDPQSRADILSMRRYVLMQAERTDEHMQIDEELLALNPRNTSLSNDLGYSLADRGESLDRALTLTRRAVASDPTNAAFLDSLGWTHYKRGELADAERCLSRAAQVRAGQDPIVHDHLGDAAYRLGKPDQAREAWRSALRLAEQKAAADRTGADRELRERIEQKLAALEAGAPVDVAPLAAGDDRAEMQ